MKQHLKTKVLDDKALKLSTSFCEKNFIIYIPSLHVSEAIEISYFESLVLRLCTFDWRNKYI